MKKSTYGIFAIFAFMFCLTTSCKDDSNTFSEYYFIDTDLNNALVSTVKLCKDTACAKTTVHNFYINHTSYTINFPESLSEIEDTLSNIPKYATLLDSFSIQINRTAEHLSSNIQAAFNSNLTNYTFNEPYKVLTQTSSAPAINYFQKTSEVAIYNSIENITASKLQTEGATATWDSILNVYQTINPGSFYFNLPKYVSQKAVDATFRLAAVEEYYNRTDSTRRKVDIIKEVYRILD